MNAAASVNLERRKQVQVRLRADLLIESQRYQGRVCYVVKDPVSLRYYRFQERERFLLGLMDGRHTLDNAQREYEKHFRPARLALEEIEGFARLLLTTGLAESDSPQTGIRLYHQRRQEERRRRLQGLTQVLYLQIPVFDPDKLLGRMLGRLAWVFSAGFTILSAGLMLAALLLLATHFDAFLSRLPSSQEFLNFRSMVFLWAALGVVKIVHEFGHGLCCKAFGGEVHEMGVLFLCLFPCLYCNVTDSWMMPGKWQRILVSFAGIFVELLIASVATIVWWAAPGQVFLGQFCLSLMVVCSVNTLVFNGNPLLRYDGYYMLADWLEIPNLRERAGRFLKNLALVHFLGVEIPPEPAMARWRRWLFVSFALASYCYRWIVASAVLWYLYRFLQPYELGALGAALALLSAASMVGWPLYRLVQNIQRRGRLPQMKPGRVLRSAATAIILPMLAGLLPLPLSGIRQTALVQLQPGAAEGVFVPARAVLERLYVHDGQLVQPNEILAEFRSLDLETQREEARCEHEIRSAQLQAFQERSVGLANADERAAVEVARATANGERALFAQQMEVLDKMVKRLVLRAPRAGVIMSPPRIDDVGKTWIQDEGTPFCMIAEPHRLQALMPVSPAEHRLLQEESARRSRLTAAIHVRGARMPSCRGQVARLPESEAKQVPLSLTTRGGGPLPAEPTLRSAEYAPLTQHYLVPIDFNEPTGRIHPGMLAQVQINCRWRPVAWWLWRTIATTFDFSLM